MAAIVKQQKNSAPPPKKKKIPLPKQLSFSVEGTRGALPVLKSVLVNHSLLPHLSSPGNP